MYYLNPIKIMCTTRLNGGIFRVHQFSVVTPAQLQQIEILYSVSTVYGGTLDN
jgi:hypothetical protein